MIQLVEGMAAPDFQGINQNKETISLSGFKGKKLILYFYPKDDTPGCTAEACNLNDNYEFWISKGYEVIGISPDNAASHQKFVKKYGLKFNLIADTAKEILEAYGVWGEKMNYGKTYMGVIRTTFVITEEGIIEKIFKKIDTKEHTNQIINSLLIK
jgi:thioredoxin-dependent peroxiredoxin